MGAAQGYIPQLVAIYLTGFLRFGAGSTFIPRVAIPLSCHTESNMPDLIEDPPATSPSPKPAKRLRATMAAVRLCFTWLGVVRLMYPV